MQTNKSLLCILVWFDAAARPRLKMHVCVAVLDLVPVKHAAEKHQGGGHTNITPTHSAAIGLSKKRESVKEVLHSRQGIIRPLLQRLELSFF